MASGVAPAFAADGPISIGTRRELFVDRFLIEKLDSVSLQLQHPQPAGTALKFDQPWEGQVSGYVTVIHDGDLYRMYYRGRPLTGYGDNDPRSQEVTCYAESRDGITFTRPKLGLISFGGNKDNNAILADVGHVTHNFAPFLDSRPGVPASERFKAVGGSSESGLIAYVSEDGIRFRKLQDKPIITGGAFDSQNNVLWSDHEQCYVCFFRTFKNGVRWITRTTSTDFLTWTPAVDMTFGDAPNEHLYTNQTVAYFRAPHIYIGTAARFWPGRRSLSDEQVAALQLDAPVNYGGLKLESSDAVLLTSRGGNRYDRTFLESLVRPGADLKNWTARSNYPARGIVPTGPTEMSIYVQRHYGQPTHYLQRLTFRTDGLAAVHAGYQPGELVTKPVTFEGRQLTLNMSSSAAGGVFVEIQDAAGRPIPGFTLAECHELNTDDLARAVSWKNGSDVSTLAGKPIRLRFRLKDADLFALQFVK
ncbi:MAG: hypothetical protein HUU20_06360 [Pirellulales bacterium]|nr:hypothetical protein [Pirellulales bacterium]